MAFEKQKMLSMISGKRNKCGDEREQREERCVNRARKSEEGE